MINKNKIFSYAIGAILIVSAMALVGYIAFDQGRYYQQTYDENIGLQKVAPFGAYMSFLVIHEDGSSVLAWSGHNTMTTVGLNACRWYISGVPAANANFTWIAIGTGSGGGVGSTALATEAFRASATFENTTTAAGNWTLTYTWTAGTFSGEAITEAGVLNAATGGILLNYQDFAAITLSASDSLQVTFEFEIAQG